MHYTVSKLNKQFLAVQRHSKFLAIVNMLLYGPQTIDGKLLLGAGMAN